MRAMNEETTSTYSFINVQRMIKWSFDRLIAAIALLFFSPFLLLISIAIYLRIGRPILFSQPRPGQNSCIFTFYKFRTMTDERDVDGDLMPDEQRLTEFGQFLRQSSLDELPQLWNVLKGDMSFVGPRPLIVEYLDRYTPEQARRHRVKPGITGLAQIKGRNAINWEEKFKLDVWYIDHWNLWMDLKILFLTIWKVLRKEGINEEGYTTSQEFRGQLDKLNRQNL
jgi:lipopolysaccharide/colanic/teichoic acid biosynthesis glycosyltransferase